MKKKSISIDELLNITKCEVLSQEELRTIAGGQAVFGQQLDVRGGGVKDKSIKPPDWYLLAR
jgi:hypothetical protein